MASKYLLLLAFTGMLSFMSCGSDDDYIPLEQQAKHNASAAPSKYDYAIYLENSSSLNGYLNAAGDSSFKDNINDLITEINGFPEKGSLNLFDVNTKVIPVAIDADVNMISDYINSLNQKAFQMRSQTNGGNQKQSNLSEIIKNIIDSTGINDVSILISDCIFSPGKNKNATSYLSDQKNNIKLHLNERLRTQPISTLVLQFTSDFNGEYYTQNNISKNGNYKQRPYYVVCLGKEDALQHLLKYVQTRNRTKGFHNFLFFTNTKSYNVAPRVTNSTYYTYNADEPMSISNIEKDGQDNKFRIKLSVDFSKLPVNEAYIHDSNNYILSKGYAIDAVSSSDKKGFTHQIILVADKPQPGKVQCSLKKQLPGWVIASNLDDDSNLSTDSLAGKTFGIRYLLDGMFLAYDSYSNTPHYFTFSISVKE